MKKESPLWSSISLLIGIVIAILALIRGRMLLPLLLAVFALWLLWWLLTQALPLWRNNRAYARWAKVFNLKQMAQTMNYLSENNLLEYAVLEEKAAAATAHHNELSAQIKAAEKRMAEIAVLRTHIVNYAKTREVYVAYRKAGYEDIKIILIFTVSVCGNSMPTAVKRIRWS